MGLTGRDFMIIGIDASNISRGGGVTHLIELLKSVNPSAMDIHKVIIWGHKPLLDAIEDTVWLSKQYVPTMPKPLFFLYWQLWGLRYFAAKLHCNVLFIPGGLYLGRFSPAVCMSQNLLPFEWQEMQRFGWSKTGFRLLLLRYMQAYSFRRAAGTIFLTDYAKQTVMNVVRLQNDRSKVIPHGVGQQFLRRPRKTRAIDRYSNAHPFRLLYVSWIAPYKHQLTLCVAIDQLRKKNIPIRIDLIGPVTSFGEKILKQLQQIDPQKIFIHYHGEVSYADLNTYYEKADLFVFASTCENMPIILLEAMAAGLPIACSNRGPMPEVLGDTGVYFDPENISDIVKTLSEILLDHELRMQLAQKSFAKAQLYTWTQCAGDTFEFLTKIAGGAI